MSLYFCKTFKLCINYFKKEQLKIPSWPDLLKTLQMWGLWNTSTERIEDQNVSVFQSFDRGYFWFFESHAQVEMRRVDVTRKTKERERSMHQSAVSSTCEIFVKINKTNSPEIGINSQSCLRVLCALRGLSPHQTFNFLEATSEL